MRVAEQRGGGGAKYATRGWCVASRMRVREYAYDGSLLACHARNRHEAVQPGPRHARGAPKTVAHAAFACPMKRACSLCS